MSIFQIANQFKLGKLQKFTPQKWNGGDYFTLEPKTVKEIFNEEFK